MQIFNKYNCLILILLCAFTPEFYAQSSKFKVVLDAGHGGNDFGATYHGMAEKTIALSITLKVGKKLEKNSNVEVIYTRDSDVFIELNKRAEIANNNKASIFVSIHCNANKNTSAEGYETYVMGMHRNASNLEVAKAENDVVTMEKDYKLKYNDYDPKSPESAIGTSLMQEEYMANSISLASRVQNGMVSNFGRRDRRVKQAGFLVLRQIYMPRILIEMGFISNVREGNYMNSESGQEEIAEGIANAIISYKNEYYGSSANESQAEKYVPATAEKKADTKAEKVTVTKSTAETKVALESKPVEKVIIASNKGIVFKVQIAASGTNLDLVPSNFKGLNNLSVSNEGGKLFKYMYGNTSDYDQAKVNLEEAKAKGFQGAYIIAFKDGQKINLQEALK